MKLFLVGIIVILNLNITAQAVKLDSVISKMKTDKKSFKHFCVLGKYFSYDISVCYDTALFKKAYIRCCSHSPFLYFIDEKKMTKAYSDYLTKNKLFTDVPRRLFSDDPDYDFYYRIYKIIDKIWKKRRAKKFYKKFITNKENYRFGFLQEQPDSIHLEVMNQFLNHYYIWFPPSFKNPFFPSLPIVEPMNKN